MGLRDWLEIERRVLPAKNRKLGFARASVKNAWLDGEDPRDSPWLALCNMRVGESFTVLGEHWVVEQIGQKQMRLRSDKGNVITLNPRRDNYRQRRMLREIMSLLEWAKIDEVGDLRKALMRDPLFSFEELT